MPRVLVLLIVAPFFAGSVQAQTDPGPRPGPAAAGGPFRGLNEEESNLFWAAKDRFNEATSVSGGIGRGAGLGPTFNGSSCAGCHAQPSAGGSSPSPASPQVRRLVLQNNRIVLAPAINPEVELATLDRVPGGSQTVPSFITPDGPVRVARFIRKPDGALDGSVHDIYSIAGRADAPGCVLPQTDFAEQMEKHNVVFRIPTPTFGAGLIEAIADDTLIANWTASARQRQALGIGGRFNRSTNDGTISRFGWKAQNKSLLLFAAESYNVEEGVTNDIFPDKRDHVPGCLFNALPEDTTRLRLREGSTFEPSGYASDLVNFAAFMRLMAPPEPAVFDGSTQNGAKLFHSTGCVFCHS
ncbi:MAG: di-heme oxidoredictase family protein, partial [Bryobacteraceae bacterium]